MIAWIAVPRDYVVDFSQWRLQNAAPVAYWRTAGSPLRTSKWLSITHSDTGAIGYRGHAHEEFIPYERTFVTEVA